MEKFKDITEDIIAIHDLKNRQYGNSFSKRFSQFDEKKRGAGLQYAVGRMADKMERLITMAFNPELEFLGNESIIDNLKDLAAYAIMTVEEVSRSDEGYDLDPE